MAIDDPYLKWWRASMSLPQTPRNYYLRELLKLRIYVNRSRTWMKSVCMSPLPSHRETSDAIRRYEANRRHARIARGRYGAVRMPVKSADFSGMTMDDLVTLTDFGA